MAYVNQERKAQIAAQVKPILKKYGIKGTLAVNHHMTLVLNISEGVIDFISNSNETCARDPYQVARGVQPSRDHISVNPYHYDKHFSGTAKAFLDEVMAAMNDGNHDRSDPQTDYFDVGWYVDVNIGRWNKPYRLAA
jgi:hypothetical protein